MSELHNRIVFLVLGLAVGAFALNYDVNDRYIRTDYTTNVIAVGTISSLPAISGTHYPQLTSAQMGPFAKYNGILTHLVNVYYGGALRATGYLFKGTGDSDPWNKVVLMADGIDQGNNRRIDMIVGGGTGSYNNLLEPNATTGKSYSPVANGYDVMFIDFADGAGDIRANAKVYLRIIEEVCSRTSGPAVVAGGFSMGGVVARLALLYGQKTTNGVPDASISKVKKYFAVDAPMQGAAGISLSMQELVRDQASGSSSYATMMSLAAQQMLFQHVSVNGSSEHDKFYNFLAALGNYPKGIGLYSFAASNWANPYSGSSYQYVINVNATFDLAIPNPITFWPFIKIGSTTVTKPYKTVTWSGKDLEPGSSYDLISDIETNAKPYFNASAMAGQLIAWGVINPALLVATGGTATLSGASISSSYTAGFRPTFMPISSVFDLKSTTPASLKNQSSLQALIDGGYTPFNKLYLNSSRLEHITFTTEFCGYIVNALSDVVTPNMWYNILSRSNINQALNVNNAGSVNGVKDGSNVQVWSSHRDPDGQWASNQNWKFVNLGNGYFNIVSRANQSEGLNADASKGSVTNGTNVQVWNFGAGTNENWQVKFDANGYCRIISRANTGVALDVDIAKGPVTDGSNVQLWSLSGGTNQDWLPVIAQ